MQTLTNRGGAAAALAALTVELVKVTDILLALAAVAYQRRTDR